MGEIKAKIGTKPGVKAEASSQSTKASAAARETEKAKPASKSAKAAASKSAATPAGGIIRVTQLVGTIGRRRDQEATLKGLGLNKRHRSRELLDTPEIRGMVNKVRHLVKVENVAGGS